MPFPFLDSCYFMSFAMKIQFLDFNHTKPFIDRPLVSSFILPAIKLFAPL